MRLIRSKRPEKSLVFHKTVLAAPRALYGSVLQIDRRKAKGRNERGKRKFDRSSQSLTCSTNRTPVLVLHEAKPIGPAYVSLFGQFTSSRAPPISITDHLGGYRFLLILKNGPKPLREIACEGERAAKRGYRRGILSTRPTRSDGGSREECSKFPPASGPPAFADGCN